MMAFINLKFETKDFDFGDFAWSNWVQKVLKGGFRE